MINLVIIETLQQLVLSEQQFGASVSSERQSVRTVSSKLINLFLQFNQFVQA